MMRERRWAAFVSSLLIRGHAAGRIGISGGGSEAIPGGDDAFFEVHTKGACDAGIPADGRVEPDRDHPAFVLHVFFTDRRPECEVDLILVHAAQNLPAIDGPAHAVGVRGIVVGHQTVTFRVAPGQRYGCQEKAHENDSFHQHPRRAPLPYVTHARNGKNQSGKRTAALKVKTMS